MNKYRCKHTVEAMQWTATQECHDAFRAWFELRGITYATLNTYLVLPDQDLDPVKPGEWVVWADNEMCAYEDELFLLDYEPLSAPS